MARDHYDLDEMKKKPSALLVYLTLEQNRGNGPMGRKDIIDYIKEHFGGIEIQPKTVSESAAILKAMSSMEPPLVDFHQFGKNGYYLGRAESVFSVGEILRIIECFSSVGAGDEAWKPIEALMSQNDIKTLRTIRESLVHPKRKETESKAEQKYFEKVEVIARAIESKHEVIFDHAFSDIDNNEVKTEFDIHLSPYYLFTKNGRFYLLGGRLGDRSKGIHKSLYIADIANINRVKTSGDDIEPWSYSFRPESIAQQLFPYPFIQEGEFHHGEHRYEIYIASRYILLEINALFGDCYRIKEPLRRKRGDRFNHEFIIEFYGDYSLAFMLQMRYPNEIKILNLPADLRESLRIRAEEICKSYAPENYLNPPTSGAKRFYVLQARNRLAKKGK